jgi:hypothetical protein
MHFSDMPRQPDDVRSPGQSRHPAARPRLPSLRRFSDAGITGPSTRRGGRRPKSAKARNRGLGTAAAPRALWGFRRRLRPGCGARSQQHCAFCRVGVRWVEAQWGRGGFARRGYMFLRRRCGSHWRDEPSVSAVGRVPTQSVSVAACVEQWYWHYEVSILIFGGSDVGRCLGC